MKNYKRILMLLIGVAVLSLPKVNAYKLELDESYKDAKKENTYTIPVKLTLDAGEEGTDFIISNISCDTDYTDVSCAISNAGTNYNASAKAYTILKAANGTVLFDIVATNSSETSQSGVTVTLSYQGKTVSTAKKIGLNGKIPEKKASTNAKLKDIYIQNAKPSMTPKFNQDVLEYTVYNLPDTVNAITIGYECVEGSCQVDIEGPINVEGNKVYLNVGENIVKVKSTAEDGVSKVTYVLKVFKGETSFNSAKLKSIVVGDYELSPKFDANTKEYTMTVPYSLVTLATTLSYETEDEGATVEVKGHDNLVVGENEVKIKVTNADKSEEVTYTIKVTRLDDQNIIIKSYKDGKITFIDSTNEKQELTEEEFEKKYPDEYKKIKDGTYKFDEDGNLIKDDKNNSEDSKEEKKKSKTWLIVLLIVLGIAIIGVSGYFIFKKPSDKKKNKKDKDNKDKKEDENKEEPTEEDKEEVKEDVAEEKSEEDLLNLADGEEETAELQIKRRTAEDLDYDVESEIESVEHTAVHRSLDDTVDIDEALSDLMSTRQYNFKDEDE